MPAVLVTGSCGLIGSEVSLFFARQGFQVHGIDDNHRDLRREIHRPNAIALKETTTQYEHGDPAFEQWPRVQGLWLSGQAGAERITGRPMSYRRKMRAHYPAWDINKNLDHIFDEIAASWMARLAAPLAHSNE